MQDNGQAEAMHGDDLEASYTNATFGITNMASAVVDHSLRVVITSLSTIVPYEINTTVVSGLNNGNVLVGMVVSNAANGDTESFSATQE